MRQCRDIYFISDFALKKFTFFLHFRHPIFAFIKRSEAPCQNFGLKIYPFSAQILLHKPEKNATITPYEDNLRPDGGAKSDYAVSSAFSSSKNFFRRLLP